MSRKGFHSIQHQCLLCRKKSEVACRNLVLQGFTDAARAHFGRDIEFWNESHYGSDSVEAKALPLQNSIWPISKVTTGLQHFSRQKCLEILEHPTLTTSLLQYECDVA